MFAQLDLSQVPASWWFPATGAAALLFILLIIVLRRRRTKHTADDIQRLIVELEDLTRHFSAELDARSRQLQQLLQEADAKIAELENLTRSAPPPPPFPSDAPDPLTRQIYTLADAGRSPLQIARELNEHIGKIQLILSLREARR